MWRVWWAPDNASRWQMRFNSAFKGLNMLCLHYERQHNNVILWNSNIAVIQQYQSTLLRSITNAPWYVSNQTLHSDLHIPDVHTVFRERRATHRTALNSHPNPLMEPLVHPPNNRRLKRRWAFDEIHWVSVAGRLLDHRQLGQRISS
jgi:hypothetical protein